MHVEIRHGTPCPSWHLQVLGELLELFMELLIRGADLYDCNLLEVKDCSQAYYLLPIKNGKMGVSGLICSYVAC